MSQRSADRFMSDHKLEGSLLPFMTLTDSEKLSFWVQHTFNCLFLDHFQRLVLCSTFNVVWSLAILSLSNNNSLQQIVDVCWHQSSYNHRCFLSSFFCTGSHTGNFFHLWENQSGWNASGEALPTPVKRLCLRGVWDSWGSSEGPQTHGWR